MENKDQNLYDLSKIIKTSSKLTIGNHMDHLLARFRFKRSHHRVNPGLYSLGNPTMDSEVFVTANYTLSFGKEMLKDFNV